MLVFLDFEASSLGKHSYPIEVGWVFEDGASASYLIRPAPDWTDWDEQAQAIHGIPRDALLRDGADLNDVARIMVDSLTGHDLRVTAPSWDGKWLNALLRTAGYPKHTLRLGDSDEACNDTARDILKPFVASDQLENEVDNILTLVDVRLASGPPTHRALADAIAERKCWCAVRDASRSRARKLQRDAG